MVAATRVVTCLLHIFYYHALMMQEPLNIYVSLHQLRSSISSQLFAATRSELPCLSLFYAS
ncbi:hypothetical protein I7I53_06885 [Histoplasma capsulatum var. duboisii H88]|uniref:Uncharacterized protein n=1 Tax=Ajellomyces capsulatus (strain H88) TaxID=544711 RepID=A0A8A1LF67_AJEC8|nr:hypothetical protein I7I53_06885 [Histoplasma capsulatum var. duboisii H88]